LKDSASTLGNVLPLLLLCIDLLSRSGLPTLKSYESYHLSYVVASGTGCPAGQPLALQCQWALTGTATALLPVAVARRALRRAATPTAKCHWQPTATE